jgi:hypothetical protein
MKIHQGERKRKPPTVKQPLLLPQEECQPDQPHTKVADMDDQELQRTPEATTWPAVVARVDID